MPNHILPVTALLCLASAGGLAAETFTDGFGGGETSLDWQSHPLFDGAALEARSVDDAPDGDGGIGVLRHEGGGLATISYPDTVRAEDVFAVEAWADCPVESEGRDGTLTGIAFFIQLEKEGEDPEKSGFYRLVCAYRAGSAPPGPRSGLRPPPTCGWGRARFSAGSRPARSSRTGGRHRPSRCHRRRTWRTRPRCAWVRQPWPPALRRSAARASAPAMRCPARARSRR